MLASSADELARRRIDAKGYSQSVKCRGTISKEGSVGGRSTHMVAVYVLCSEHTAPASVRYISSCIRYTDPSCGW
eukprot:24047-Eustigmatos_ZCMA.PRE.1